MPIELFDQLLTKPMNRKEFLVHIGLLIFALTGMSALLKTLSDPHVSNKHTKSTTGFGARRYGV
ncbi:MAG: hypothetical protein ABI700_03285 [Chloroflexota bacterium]